MPNAPLLDFDDYDIDKVVADKEALRSTLKQRGSFEMIDAIVHMDPKGELVIGYKEVRKDEWWCKDHIPERPIFPGTLMIEGAAQMCTYDFYQRCPEMLGVFVGFGGVDQTRFRSVVEPDCRLYIVGRIERIRKTLFQYYAQGFVDRKMVFETRVTGLAV